MSIHNKPLLSAVVFLAGTFLINANSHALKVNISPDKATVDAVHNGKVLEIKRIQDEDHVITGGYSKTSRKCPPFCIQPIKVAPGVTTVGELELLEFIEKKVNNGTGVLIDARTPSWHKKSTIPGSINIPFTTFDDKKSDLIKSVALAKLGVTKKSTSTTMAKFWNSIVKFVSANEKYKWDFTNAKDILLWCNGMWCGQSPRAIKGLIKLGYPAEKIYYYRGGMQSWQMLGLTVSDPEKN